MAQRLSDRALALRVGVRIRRVRETTGLRQQALADRLRTAAATVNRIEGGTVMPTLTTLADIARELGVATARLLDDADAPVAPSGAEEAGLLASFRQLPAQHQRAVRELVAALIPAPSRDAGNA